MAELHSKPLYDAMLPEPNQKPRVPEKQKAVDTLRSYQGS